MAGLIKGNQWFSYRGEVHRGRGWLTRHEKLQQKTETSGVFCGTLHVLQKTLLFLTIESFSVAILCCLDKYIHFYAFFFWGGGGFKTGCLWCMSQKMVCFRQHPWAFVMTGCCTLVSDVQKVRFRTGSTVWNPYISFVDSGEFFLQQELVVGWLGLLLICLWKKPKTLSSWWFQIFFVFISPLVGEDFQFD